MVINKYDLKKALFVYRRRADEGGTACCYSNAPDYYLQQHDVLTQGTKPVLLSGKPVDSESLKELCSLMIPELLSDLRFLDSRVLASSWSSHGPEIWWAPPSKRGIFFHPTLKIPNGVVPWPGLIMAAEDRELHVFAVKGKERPTEKTKLFIAPVFNMHGSDICLGSAGIPDSASDHKGWENALFKSAFSEDRGEERISGESLCSFWKKLVKKSAKVFPEDKLISNKKTVGDLLKELKQGGGVR